METTRRFYAVLTLVVLVYHRSTLSDTMTEADNVSIPSLKSLHVNSNIGKEVGHQSDICEPTPDFLGQGEDDVNANETVTTESTLNSTATVDDVTRTMTLDNYTKAEFSSTLEQIKNNLTGLSDNIGILFSSLEYMNATLQAVLVEQERSMGKGSCKTGLRKSMTSKMSGQREDQSSDCPEMFSRFWGRRNISTCLWFSNITGSWAEAYIYCNVLDADLAIPNNWVLHENVTKYMQNNTKGRLYYLGGTGILKEGLWNWLKPKKHFPARMWKKGQPDNASGAEHCLAIGRYSGEYKWTDVRCDRRHHFICQRKPQVAT